VFIIKNIAFGRDINIIVGIANNAPLVGTPWGGGGRVTTPSY